MLVNCERAKVRTARHIRAIVPALSPAPRDALTESPIPASWSIPART